MNGRCVVVIWLVLLASPLPSCGPGEGPALYPVRGKVTYKGQPAAGATVMFQREDAPPPTVNGSPIVPVGMVDDDGNYTVECDEFGRGAPAGKYKVLIQWRSREAGKVDPAPQSGTKKKSRKVVADRSDGAPDLLQGRYMNANDAKFRVEVKPEKNDVEAFDVSS